MGSKRIKKIIVNALSISRIIGAIMMPLFFSIFDTPLLISIIIVLFITDCLDGILARMWGVQTRGGALLDPLGDKLLAVCCTISFVSEHHVLYIILALEIMITYFNVNRTMHGEKSVTSIIGKAKTWLLSITLVLCAIYSLKSDYLSTLDINVTYDDIMIASIITIISQLFTIIFYLKDSIKQKNIRIKKIPKLKNFKEILKILFDEENYLKDKDKPLVELVKK